MTRLKLLATFLAVILLAVEIFFIHPHHVDFWLFKIKGYSILLGLGGSFLLMYGAKAFAKAFLYRETDFYDH